VVGSHKSILLAVCGSVSAMQTIKFTDKTGLVPDEYYPKPSKMAIPEWFKTLMPQFEDMARAQYPGNSKEPTGKRCIPMLDAMTDGYTIFTSEEIRVTEHNDLPYFEWARRDKTISFHPHQQLATYPGLKENQDVPKWDNPWVIKTPPGYSCLFVPPLNNPEIPIKIFSGVVDTDTYVQSVNFPFMLVDPLFKGLIPIGTPIAQVIPFARESWKMEINTIPKEEMIKAFQRLDSMFFDKYKKLFWHKKSFN